MAIKAATNPKRNITFAENSPEIIGYRDASDDEDDEEEFVELSLKTSESGNNTLEDYDERDPERVKLRELTEENTLFNSNYANFKLNDSAIGLGRSTAPTTKDSSPIKFVIQDGYQQPLPPTKYKSSANESLKKMFETPKGNVCSLVR